jgi:hypothetical protein
MIMYRELEIISEETTVACLNALYLYLPCMIEETTVKC